MGMYLLRTRPKIAVIRYHYKCCHFQIFEVYMMDTCTVGSARLCIHIDDRLEFDMVKGMASMVVAFCHRRRDLNIGSSIP